MDFFGAFKAVVLRISFLRCRDTSFFKIIAKLFIITVQDYAQRIHLVQYNSDLNTCILYLYSDLKSISLFPPNFKCLA